MPLSPRDLSPARSYAGGLSSRYLDDDMDVDIDIDIDYPSPVRPRRGLHRWDRRPSNPDYSALPASAFQRV